jgi:hypothetical protein
MVRDDLRMEKGQNEIHYASVNIYTTVDSTRIAPIVTTVQASSKEGLESKISAIPNQVRNQYENPSIVFVEVKEGTKSSMTRAEFEDYLRRDAADTERQIDMWML